MNAAKRLAKRLRESMRRHADREALPGITYAQLHAKAETLATLLRRRDDKYVAVAGEKSAPLYVAVVAAVLAGKTFVPVSLRFDRQRLREVFEMARIILVAPEAREWLASFDLKIEPLFLEAIEKNGNDKSEEKAMPVTPQDDAYVLFTSGTTGVPKAIPISYANLEAYLDYILEKLPVRCDDVVSQTFDISFDLSMHDIFTTFLCGAKLVPIQRSALFMPNKIIEKERITIWFSVPSVAIMMDRLNLLRGTWPSLRRTIFCGEALPVYVAKKWQECATKNEVYNLYGPSELTIAVALHRFDGNKAYPSSIVPIGEVFSTHDYVVQNGELLISGPQRFKGYLNVDKDPFVRIGERLYYKTGDLVEKSEAFGLLYLGRRDNQIKVHGYRIELEEIENTAREMGTVGVALFDEKREEIVLVAERPVDLQGKVPEYMVPKRVIVVDKIPLNINMKFDRKRLQKEWLCND